MILNIIIIEDLIRIIRLKQDLIRIISLIDIFNL